MNKPNLTLNTVIDNLKKYFNVIAEITVLQYDLRLADLYQLLLSVKQENYNPNDRIVFIFDDTDYYYKNQHGFTLHNLQEILCKLDIPNYFCIILTHQNYIQSEVNAVAKEISYDPVEISVFDIWLDLYLDIPSIPYIDLNLENIKKSFVFLSRVTRKHRVILFSLLRKDQVLDNGIVSFSMGNTIDITINHNNQKASLPNNLNLLSTIPITRCNENWLVSDVETRNIYNNFICTIDSSFVYKNFEEPATIPSDFTKANNSLIQQGFLYIAAETMFYYPGNYISEKSFKGIAAKRPFVIVGPQGNLKKLKEYGFKTFDQWWSEDYDNIADPTERMLAVKKIIQSINKTPINELIALGNDMKDVLEYNYDFLINHFARTQLQKLDAQCFKNLTRNNYVPNKTFNS